MDKQVKKRILLLITGLDVGGAELLVKNFVQSLKEEYDFFVVCMTAPGEIYQQIKEMGIPVDCLNIDNPLKLPVGIKKILPFIKKL